MIGSIEHDGLYSYRTHIQRSEGRELLIMWERLFEHAERQFE